MDPNSSSHGSSSSLNTAQTDKGGGTQDNVLTKTTNRVALAVNGNGKTNIDLDNAGEGGKNDFDQHALSGVMGDTSQQLAGLVGIDPDATNSISHMICGGREEEEGEVGEEESAPRNILVSQQQRQTHYHHHPSKLKLSAQAGISHLHSDSNHGIAALITTNAGNEVNVVNGSSFSSNLVVAGIETSAPSSSLTSSLTTPAPSLAAHHLNILSAVDTAAISQMMQSGAARLSIVPGHPNTLALVPADSVTTSLGLITAHDPSDLDASEGHGHLNLDSEHLIMDRPTSSLEEDHEKLAQDKIQLHITTGKGLVLYICFRLFCYK